MKHGNVKKKNVSVKGWLRKLGEICMGICFSSISWQKMVEIPKEKDQGILGCTKKYIYQLIDSIKINHSWIGAYAIVPWVRHGDGIVGNFWVSFVAPNFQTSTSR